MTVQLERFCETWKAKCRSQRFSTETKSLNGIYRTISVYFDSQRSAMDVLVN